MTGVSPKSRPGTHPGALAPIELHSTSSRGTPLSEPPREVKGGWEGKTIQGQVGNLQLEPKLAYIQFSNSSVHGNLEHA